MYQWSMTYFLLCNIFPHRHKAASISIINVQMYLHSFIPPVQTFTRMYHVISTVSNRSHFPHVPNVRGKFQSESVFLRTATLRNRLHYCCFPEHFNFDLCKCESLFFLIFISYQFALHLYHTQH